MNKKVQYGSLAVWIKKFNMKVCLYEHKFNLEVCLYELKNQCGSCLYELKSVMWKFVYIN